LKLHKDKASRVETYLDCEVCGYTWDFT